MTIAKMLHKATLLILRAHVYIIFFAHNLFINAFLKLAEFFFSDLDDVIMTSSHDVSERRDISHISLARYLVYI